MKSVNVFDQLRQIDPFPLNNLWYFNKLKSLNETWKVRTSVAKLQPWLDAGSACCPHYLIRSDDNSFRVLAFSPYECFGFDVVFDRRNL
jgi:hypothetical protein